MRNRLKKYRKQAIAVYFALCFLYCIVKIIMPVETTRGEGLDDLGRRQIVERTNYLETGKHMTFTLPVESEPLTSIGFYLNTDELVLDGTLHIQVTDQETGKILGKTAILLEEITIDQFVTVSVDHFTNGVIQAEIYTEGSTASPRFWLNSTGETKAKTWIDGEEISYPLVYNAGIAVMTRDIKGAVVNTMIAVFFGILILVVTEDVKREKELFTGKKKPWDRFLTFYQKHRLILGGLLVAVLVGSVFYYLYDSQIRIVMNTTKRQQIISAEEPEILKFSDVEDQLIQKFVCEADTLTGVGIQMAVPEDALFQGSIYGKVTDLTAGEVLSEVVFEGTDAIEKEYMNLLFTKEVTDAKDHVFEILLEPSDEIKDSGMGFYVSKEAVSEDQNLIIDGQEVSLNLITQIHEYFHIFLKKYFFMMFAAAELFSMLLYWMIFVKNCKLETLTLTAILGLGLFYSFLILPYMAPDEGVHIDMTYRFSNMFLGIDQTNDVSIMKRMDDVGGILSTSPELSNYHLVYENLFQRVQDPSLVSATATANTYAPLLVYFPGVIGMTLARLAGLGTIPMLLFARWCNLVFFAISIWWCMKKLPFGKTALAVIALLPMTIQQCNSLSYDAVIMSVLFLFSTYVISMIYEEKTIQTRDMVITAVLAAVLVYGKSGVYIPLCLLVCLIPSWKFGGWKKKILSTFAIMGITCFSYIGRNSGTVSMVVSTTADTSAVGNAAGNAVAQGYTLGYFLENPWKLIQMLCNTLTDKIQFYVESMVGQKLGWVEIEISEIIVIGFVLLFFVSMLKVRGENQYVTKGQKWWIAMVCLLCTGMILMGMLLSWTPYGNVSIEGVQGRYFIPLLLAASLLGRNSTILLNKNKDRAIFCTGMILQLLTVMYMIKAVVVIGS